MKQESFIDWVNGELRRRGWTNSELAARGGLIPGSLNNVLNGSRSAGPDICRGIARGLGLPEEMVFRKAGLLSPLRGDPEERSLQELIEMAKTLTPHQRREATYYMSYLKFRTQHNPD